MISANYVSSDFLSFQSHLTFVLSCLALDQDGNSFSILLAVFLAELSLFDLLVISNFFPCSVLFLYDFQQLLLRSVLILNALDFFTFCMISSMGNIFCNYCEFLICIFCNTESHFSYSTFEIVRYDYCMPGKFVRHQMAISHSLKRTLQCDFLIT